MRRNTHSSEDAKCCWTVECLPTKRPGLEDVSLSITGVSMAVLAQVTWGVNVDRAEK